MVVVILVLVGGLDRDGGHSGGGGAAAAADDWVRVGGGAGVGVGEVPLLPASPALCTFIGNFSFFYVHARPKQQFYYILFHFPSIFDVLSCRVW